MGMYKIKSIKNKNIIDAMVERIVDRFEPDKIILFGSWARDSAGSDSDVDYLIVMPVSGSKRAKRIEIGVAVADFFVPKDIFVTTPEEMEQRKYIPGTIERPAFLEGKVLYDRTQ